MHSMEFSRIESKPMALTVVLPSFSPCGICIPRLTVSLVVKCSCSSLLSARMRSLVLFISNACEVSGARQLNTTMTIR